jgi:hypothetical protein
VLGRGGAGARGQAGEWLREAMRHFADAEPVRPSDDDSSILRWNACARLMAKHPDLGARQDDRDEPVMSE